MYLNSVILLIGWFTFVRCQYMSYYDAVFGPLMACRATLKTKYQGVTLQKCAPFSDLDGVTEVAEVEKIDLKLIVQADQKPGLEIYFKAFSPNSLQKYKINVRSIDGKIYCGIVSTPKPSKKVVHRISLLMTCKFNTLSPSINVKVAVTPTIDGIQKGDSNKSLQIPYCTDTVMIKSDECAEYRRNAIKFHLKQVNNGLKVMLDIKLAYRGFKNSKIFIQLRLQEPGKGINGFVDVGEVVTLNYPQVNYTFENLVIGQRYRVLIWRNTDTARYIGDITLENTNRREKRHISWLARTLEQRTLAIQQKLLFSSK